MEDVHMHKHEGASGLIRISERLRTGERSNRKEVRWLPAQPASQGDNVEDGAEDSRREERDRERETMAEHWSVFAKSAVMHYGK